MWLYVPPQFCPSAPAEADSTSDLDSLCRTAGRSLTWNGKPSLSRYWKQRWKTALWIRRLFGTISGPSTATLGVESWIASLRASRASRIVPPASREGPTTTVTSGRTPQESSEKSDPASSSWSRFREDYAITSTESGQSYDQWVSELRRDYSRRSSSVLPTSVNDSSPWRTPTGSDGEGGVFDLDQTPDGSNPKMKLRDQGANWPTSTAVHEAPNHRSHTVNGPRSLLETAQLWATPVVSRGPTATAGGDHEAPTEKLDGEARNWPSPTATDGEKESIRYSKGDLHLSGAARQFPTPAASDGERESLRYKRGNPTLGGIARQMFPTPSASDTHGWDGPNKENPSKSWEVYSRLVLLTSRPGHICSPKCRRLNPLFVERLMGWPGGWTLLPIGLRDYESSVTEWSHWLQRQRSALSSIAR